MKKENTTEKKKPTFAKKLFIISLIFLISMSGGYVFAALPVYDVANHTAQFKIMSMQEKNRTREFLETMRKWVTQAQNWKTQFDHGVKVWKEVDQMRGNWKNALIRLADQEFVKAVIGEEGRDLIKLGWELRNGTPIETLPDKSLEALNRIEKVINKRDRRSNSTNAGEPTVREDLQEIFGQVPGNRPDIENAHRTIARALSSIGDINTAIEERRQNIQQWKRQISAGGLVPGDLERLQIMINAESQDIDLLNSRLTALNLEVQTAQTGLLATGESDREISRARAEQIAASFKNGAGFVAPTNTDSTENRRR